MTIAFGINGFRLPEIRVAGKPTEGCGCAA